MLSLKPNGDLAVSFADTQIDIVGGPFNFNFDPADYVSVKMAAEIPKECDISIPTRDFNVPVADTLVIGAALALMMAHSQDKPIYVGCMGGIGRTGLFIAAVLKILNVDDPVETTRRQYLSHAVETAQQVAFIGALDVSKAQRMLETYTAVIGLRKSYSQPEPAKVGFMQKILQSIANFIAKFR